LGVKYSDASSATGTLQTDVAAIRVATLLDLLQHLVTPMPSAVPLSSASSAAAAVGHEPTSCIAAAPVQDANMLCNGVAESPARPASCCGGGGSPPPPAGAAPANSDLQRKIAETQNAVAAFVEQERKLLRKFEALWSSDTDVAADEAAGIKLESELADTSADLRFLRAANPASA
jgi:hypothetical protein